MSCLSTERGVWHLLLEICSFTIARIILDLFDINLRLRRTTSFSPPYLHGNLNQIKVAVSIDYSLVSMTEHEMSLTPSDYEHRSSTVPLQGQWLNL